MRNTQNLNVAQTEPLAPTYDETNWSLSGAFVGFAAWLMALGIPYLYYGNNTLFFFLYTWPFFLALMRGGRCFSLVDERQTDLYHYCNIVDGRHTVRFVIHMDYELMP